MNSLELPLLFMAGILGSAHCLGMCGPFALSIGSLSHTWQENVLRQLLYTAGRIFTYAVLGATAGYGGARLTQALPAVVWLPGLLGLVAGLFLIWQGAKAAGWLDKGRVGGSLCLASTFFAPFLRASGGGPFLAGLFTGLLPCGLLYGMLALAASTHDLSRGALLMTVFGLGTAPGMLVAGLGGNLLHLGLRRKLYALAAWSLILTGVLTCARGAYALPRPSYGTLQTSSTDSPKDAKPPACPYCDGGK